MVRMTTYDVSVTTYWVATSVKFWGINVVHVNAIFKRRIVRLVNVIDSLLTAE